MLPAAVEALAEQAAPGRQRLLAAHHRPRGARRRRGVARAHRVGARCPTVRGRLHVGGHRGRQPRGQGHRMAAQRAADPARNPDRGQRHRAPRGPRPGRAPRPARGRDGRLAETPTGADTSRSTDCARLSSGPRTSPSSASCGPTTRSARCSRWPKSSAAVAREHDVPFHTHAVEVVCPPARPVPTSPAPTSLTISGHKVGGPLGVGALLARRDARLVPLVHGGGQERPGA